VAFVNDKPNFVIFFGTAREIQQITQGRLLREKAFSVRKPDKSKNIFAFQSFLSDSLEDQEERRKALVCSVVAGVGFLSDT
ncbi:MAG: hypothetical protein KDI30_03600, partial [Pseudomonadales bacterium]|nr:hypothetical protein [Pseudomonadales bacterium]